jgi:hypothetical protein
MPIFYFMSHLYASVYEGRIFLFSILLLQILLFYDHSLKNDEIIFMLSNL